MDFQLRSNLIGSDRIVRAIAEAFAFTGSATIAAEPDAVTIADSVGRLDCRTLRWADRKRSICMRLPAHDLEQIVADLILSDDPTTETADPSGSPRPQRTFSAATMFG